MSLRPDTEDHRKIMKAISQLRICAEAKRWLSGPSSPMRKVVAEELSA
jgi:hypothetical protein